MKSEEIGILIKKFIFFCQKRANKDKSIKTNIQKAKFTELEKCMLEFLFDQYLLDSYVDVELNVHDIYSEFTLKMCPEQINVKNEQYYKFKLLKSSPLCNVYECVVLREDIDEYIIVKAYYKNNPLEVEITEKKIMNYFNTKNVNVAKIYRSFNSEHFVCYPIQRLTTTLHTILKQKMLDEDEKGIPLDSVILLLKNIVDVLEILHCELGYLYVDFSASNTGLYKNQFYMYDFGGAIKISSKPISLTKKYASLRAYQKKNVEIYDDFESIAFLMLDAYCGYFESPFTDEYNTETKSLLINEMRNGVYGSFFQKYFEIIYKFQKPYDELRKLTKQFL